MLLRRDLPKELKWCPWGPSSFDALRSSVIIFISETRCWTHILVKSGFFDISALLLLPQTSLSLQKIRSAALRHSLHKHRLTKAFRLTFSILSEPRISELPVSFQGPFRSSFVLLGPLGQGLAFVCLVFLRFGSNSGFFSRHTFKTDIISETW